MPAFLYLCQSPREPPHAESAIVLLF